MKFTSLEERKKLLDDFNKKADALTVKLKKEIPTNSVIVVETITEWEREINLKTRVPDDIYDQKGKTKVLLPNPGEIYVAYIRQPHLLTAIQVMDKLAIRQIWAAGLFAWDAMVLPESSTEINLDRNKITICGRLGQMLDVALPDVKKN